MTSELRAPIATAIDSLGGDALTRFLAQQRWFAAKGAASPTARIVDSIVMPWGDGRFAIARVAVSAGDTTTLYQLPVAVSSSDEPHVPPTAIIASAPLEGTSQRIFDAAHDPEFREGLAKAVAGGRTVESAGITWTAGPIGTRRFAAGDRIATRVGSAEQSNTSIVVGEEAILKLFRVLKPGVHPDLEVTHFLTTRTSFTHAPALLGSVTAKTDAERMTLGMVQEFLPGARDAWSYALERGASYFTAPANRDAPNDFTGDARTLGAVTRAMHEALGSDDDDPDFAPEPVSHEDLDRWSLRTRQSIRDALALLERRLSSADFPRERAAEARALVTRGDHYAGWVDEIDDALGDDLGMRIRVHGDYHLGQVLRTSAGEFMVIDFEGEPSRSLEERREKTSPLRDVAGMLRSVAYAAATLAMNAGNAVDPQTRELRAARWERDVRAAFLAGYLGEPSERDDHPDVLPEDEAHVRQLIVLFEMEKAFYELAYELNNRPAWAWIPMRGIAKLAMR